MGNCLKASNTARTEDRIFQRKVNIEIKCKAYKDPISLKLNEPENIQRKEFEFNTINLIVTSCIIPGQDPRGERTKDCQDSLFFEQKGNSMLAGVFDGHGKHGREVVKFCLDFMINFFRNNNFIENPKEALINLIEECDKEVLKNSKINCSTSGTTAAIIFINDSEIWACSVGDSRALLGTQPKRVKIIETPNFITNNPYRKPLIFSKAVKPVQLTLDQKPNISYELERILKAGGTVQQLSNSEGIKEGPYRVWTKSGKIPGLAMSRSIGDEIAKSIGVISKPIVYNSPLSHARDQFIILGSDGIWDVLENSETVNFVEKFRDLCSTSINLKKKCACCDNSIIAEFLCEEARYRWLGVCCEEDVTIDDISTCILEIKAKNPHSSPIIKRKGITIEQSLEHHDENAIAIVMTERFDIKRGSNAVIDEKDEEEEED